MYSFVHYTKQQVFKSVTGIAMYSALIFFVYRKTRRSNRKTYNASTQTSYYNIWSMACGLTGRGILADGAPHATPKRAKARFTRPSWGLSPTVPVRRPEPLRSEGTRVVDARRRQLRAILGALVPRFSAHLPVTCRPAGPGRIAA